VLAFQGNSKFNGIDHCSVTATCSFNSYILGCGCINTNGCVLTIISKGGNIIADLKATNPWATIDELHFTNIIFNLLDNAVKYSKPDAPLELKVKTRNNDNEDTLYVIVEDNGIGIKKEHLRRIFDKFHRVPTGNVHNVKGFGLGLAYVKKMVQKHNGTIKAESEPNIGTIFTITIPTIKK
jgi:signal transduction histidine kinase